MSDSYYDSFDLEDGAVGDSYGDDYAGEYGDVGPSDPYAAGIVDAARQSIAEDMHAVQMQERLEQVYAGARSEAHEIIRQSAAGLGVGRVDADAVYARANELMGEAARRHGGKNPAAARWALWTATAELAGSPGDEVALARQLAARAHVLGGPSR
jgi:hypothetical protein